MGGAGRDVGLLSPGPPPPGAPTRLSTATCMSGLLLLSHLREIPLKEQNLGEAGRLLWNWGDEVGSREHPGDGKGTSIGECLLGARARVDYIRLILSPHSGPIMVPPLRGVVRTK